MLLALLGLGFRLLSLLAVDAPRALRRDSSFIRVLAEQGVSEVEQFFSLNVGFGPWT